MGEKASGPWSVEFGMPALVMDKAGDDFTDASRTRLARFVAYGARYLQRRMERNTDGVRVYTFVRPLGRRNLVGFLPSDRAVLLAMVARGWPDGKKRAGGVSGNEALRRLDTDVAALYQYLGERSLIDSIRRWSSRQAEGIGAASLDVDDVRDVVRRIADQVSRKGLKEDAAKIKGILGGHLPSPASFNALLQVALSALQMDMEQMSRQADKYNGGRGCPFHNPVCALGGSTSQLLARHKAELPHGAIVHRCVLEEGSGGWKPVI